MSTLMTMMKSRQTPEDVLGAIVDDILKAETQTPIDSELEKYIQSLYSGSRQWGVLEGDIQDIEADYRNNEDGFIVMYSNEVYSRGCYMGAEQTSLFIPDWLVEAFEEYRDNPLDETEKAYQNKIHLYVKSELERYMNQMTEEKKQESIKRAQQEKKNKSLRYSEYQKLKEEFGE